MYPHRKVSQRKRILTVTYSHGSVSSRKRILTEKYPYGNVPHGNVSSWKRIPTKTYPHGNVFPRKRFLTAFLWVAFSRTRFLAAGGRRIFAEIPRRILTGMHSYGNALSPTETHSHRNSFPRKRTRRRFLTATHPHVNLFSRKRISRETHFH